MDSNTTRRGQHNAGEPIVVRYRIGPNEQPSTALVRVIAELAGEAPIAIGPLYEHIDLEALDDLLGHGHDRTSWPSRVSIDLDRYSVSIDESAVAVTVTVGGSE